MTVFRSNRKHLDLLFRCVMVYSRSQSDLSIEIRHLHTFLAVADALSFSKAAERLGISQPPLSRQIKRLETQLAVQLFDRSRSQVRLTEAGLVFAEGARRIVSQIERTVQDAQLVSSGLVGQLVIGIDGSAIACDRALRLIADYQKQFPDRPVRVEELDMRSQLNALRQDEIAFGFVDSKQVSGLELPSMLDSMSVAKAHLQVVLPTLHPLATALEISLPDIAQEDYILDSYWGDYITALSEQHYQLPFSPHVVQSVQSIRLTLSLVANGKGISVLPLLAEDMLMHSGIVCRPLSPVVEADLLSVVWRRAEDRTTVLSWLTSLGDASGQHEKIRFLQSRLDKSEALLRN